MNDYFEDFEHLKTPMKTYWNLHGPKVDRHVLQLFGIPWRHNGIVVEWLVEWYGGVDAINSIISKYDNKIYRADAFNMGTYEFKFKINDLKLGNSDYIISYNAVVDGSGEIDVTDDDGNTFYTIYDAYINDDMEWGWEIKDELRDIMNETVEKIIDMGFEVYADEVSIVENFLNKIDKKTN